MDAGSRARRTDVPKPYTRLNRPDFMIDHIARHAPMLLLVALYRPDRPWSGNVQLCGFGANIERLPAIRAVAQYGLFRKVRP